MWWRGRDTTIDAGELLRFCSDGLPAFKAPKQHRRECASLPKTERGKLDRKVLVGADVDSVIPARGRAVIASGDAGNPSTGMARAYGISTALAALRSARPGMTGTPYRPVRASELTQPTMRDLTFSMSFLVKKSSGFTRSTG